MPTLPKISPELINKYQEELSQSFSDATLKRKYISLNKFLDWAKAQNIIEQNPLIHISRPESPFKKKSPHLVRENLNPVIGTKDIVIYQEPYISISQPLQFLPLHLALEFTINFSKTLKLLLPTQPPFPDQRYLSFQGRLTNQYGNPIISANSVVFQLYDAGSLLRAIQSLDSGTCSISPDTDGIFSVLLGRTARNRTYQ